MVAGEQRDRIGKRFFRREPVLLFVAEFGKAIGIGRGMAYELVRRGEVKQVRRFGRLIRIHRDALRVVDQGCDQH